MRISDWSSDVCSSDLLQIGAGLRNLGDYGASVIARRTWQCPCRHQCTTWRVPCPHFAFAFHILASSARAHPMRHWGGLLPWPPPLPSLAQDSSRVPYRRPEVPIQRLLLLHPNQDTS